MKSSPLPLRETAPLRLCHARAPFWPVAACLLGGLVMLMPAPAEAQNLRSTIDAAGSSVDRQLGEWFGVAPPRRAPSATRKRVAMPAQAPLPPRRPQELADGQPPLAAAPVPPPAPGASGDKVTSEAQPPITLAPAPPANAPVVHEPMERKPDTPGPVERKTAERAPEPARDDSKASDSKSSAGTDTSAVPLPPVRPAREDEVRIAALPEPAPANIGKEKQEAPDTPAPPQKALVPTVCPEISNEDLGIFTPMDVPTTQTACTVDRGVTLSAVRMKDGRLVKLAPAALMRCEMAAAVAVWLRDEVDPLVATLGSPLETVKVAGSQQCRPRNRVAGAKISEHGRGNALDTAGYVLKDGRQIDIGGTGATAMPRGFQQQLKASACAGFTTILGPGSDGYHEKHLHVDRASRRSGAVLCQWAIGPREKSPDKPADKSGAKPDDAPQDKQP